MQDRKGIQRRRKPSDTRENNRQYYLLTGGLGFLFFVRVYGDKSDERALADDGVRDV